MNNIVVFKATHHMHNGVNLPYVGKELVAQPLALRGTLYQPGNINKLNRCGGKLFGVVHLGQGGQSFVRHGNHANIWFYGAKRKICRGGAGIGNSVK